MFYAYMLCMNDKATPQSLLNDIA
ncbi:MAG: hypothetical protein JWQ04_2921, partial [Pedosphaera sp.]|nr:hypothetical protein [Pedosphaera sp.]